MAQTYDNTNSGAIFKKKYKDSDKHPDLTGPLYVDGVEYQVAAWSNENDRQGKCLSLKISKKEEKVATAVSSSGSTDEPF